MPVYVYAVRGADGCFRDHFETRQRMSEEPLAVHPITREPVERVPQLPNVRVKSAKIDSSQKLVDRGFTRYEKAGDGKYVKTGGPSETPDTIQK